MRSIALRHARRNDTSAAGVFVLAMLALILTAREFGSMRIPGLHTDKNGVLRCATHERPVIQQNDGSYVCKTDGEVFWPEPPQPCDKSE